MSFVFWLGRSVAASAECLRELGLSEGETINGATLQAIPARPLGVHKPTDGDDDTLLPADE